MIRRWTIAVAPEALGLTVLALVGVRASRPCAQLVEALAQFPQIAGYHSVSGRLSFALKLRASTTERLLVLIEQLKQLNGIERIETAIERDTLFRAKAAPLAPGGNVAPFAPHCSTRIATSLMASPLGCRCGQQCFRAPALSALRAPSLPLALSRSPLAARP